MNTLDINTAPELPEDMSRGIGVIGCGGIARCGHLPAYRKHGFRVAAVASRRSASAHALADEFGIHTRYDDWRRLIDDPAVEVVDITVPHDADRLLMIEAAAEAGKHILVQKPLAHTMPLARRMIDLAAKGRVKLAVNQNARWCPQYRAARLLIEQGWIGAPVLITHRMLNSQDSGPCPAWCQDAERFQLIEYTVHHLDLVRYWTGREPDRVKASIIRKPGQQRRAEMIVSVQMKFNDDLLAVVTDDNAAHPTTPLRSTFCIDGLEGHIDSRVMHDPYLEVCGDRVQGGACRLDLQGQWFPDAFAGTMGELMCAIEQDREPAISGRDNLNTLRLVFDAYRDAATA